MLSCIAKKKKRLKLQKERKFPHRLLAPNSGDYDSVLWCMIWELAFLANSWVMLLFLGPHPKKHCFKEVCTELVLVAGCVNEWAMNEWVKILLSHLFNIFRVNIFFPIGISSAKLTSHIRGRLFFFFSYLRQSFSSYQAKYPVISSLVSLANSRAHTVLNCEGARSSLDSKCFYPDGQIGEPGSSLLSLL